MKPHKPFEVGDFEAGPVRLAAIADRYLVGLATRARPRTVKESGAILERIIGELGVETVEDLSRARVKAWRERRLAAGASNKTANNQLAVLLASLASAVESEMIPAHPLAGLKSLPVGPRHQRRKPRALAEWEIAKLLQAVHELDDAGKLEHAPCAEWLTIAQAAELVGWTWEGVSQRARAERWVLSTTVVRGKLTRTVRSADVLAAFRGAPRIQQALLVRVLLETGARWGELTLATWGDVDTSAAVLTLRAENTKTERERAIPLRRELCEQLVAYRLECAAVTGAMPGASDPIFLTPHGRPWRHGANFRKFLRAAYERAGLLEPKKARGRDGYALNVHTLRHTCITRLLTAGVPVPIVQALVGHASPQMTLRVYSHLKAESARSYIEAVGTPMAAHVARARTSDAR